MARGPMSMPAQKLFYLLLVLIAAQEVRAAIKCPKGNAANTEKKVADAAAAECTATDSSATKCHGRFKAANGGKITWTLGCGDCATATKGQTNEMCFDCSGSDCKAVVKGNIESNVHMCPEFDGKKTDLEQRKTFSEIVYCNGNADKCQKLEYETSGTKQVFIGCKADCQAKKTSAKITDPCSDYEMFKCPTTTDAIAPGLVTTMNICTDLGTPHCHGTYTSTDKSPLKWNMACGGCNYKSKCFECSGNECNIEKQSKIKLIENTIKCPHFSAAKSALPASLEDSIYCYGDSKENIKCKRVDFKDGDVEKTFFGCSAECKTKAGPTNCTDLLKCSEATDLDKDNLKEALKSKSICKNLAHTKCKGTLNKKSNKWTLECGKCGDKEKDKKCVECSGDQCTAEYLIVNDATDARPAAILTLTVTMSLLAALLQ